MAQHIFQYHANHIYEKAVYIQTVDAFINGKQKYLWTQSMSNELGRLAQWNDVGVKSKDCVNFIHHLDVPNDIKVAYAKKICDYRPLKSDQYIIGLSVGGYKLDYSLNTGCPTASMLETIF